MFEQIKTFDLVNKYAIEDYDMGGDEGTGFDYLTCESPGEVCCRQTSREPEDLCSDLDSYNDLTDSLYFKIYNDKVKANASRVASFVVTSNPFSVKIEYENL